jgi:hypothetical protein
MPDKDLMKRTHELVSELGKKWKQIATLLESEGYLEKGKPLSDNTIRKRYGRWLKSEAPSQEPRTEHREPGPKEESISRQTPLETPHKSDLMISAKEVLDLLKGSMERRDGILAAQFQKEQDKEYDELREQRLEALLAERLDAKVADVVPAVVNEELQAMQQEGSAFKESIQALVSDIVEEKMSEHLLALLEGIEVKEKSAGPGRGHKGSRVTKLSATMPSEVYDEMKSLGGVFSSHLAAACQLYLRARGKHPTQ